MRLATIALIALVIAGSFVGYLAGTFRPAATTTAITTETTTETTTFMPNFVNGYLGQWNSTTDYPVPVQGLACVSNLGYVYCVGGGSEENAARVGDVIYNDSYYAALSSNGIGRWIQTANYPIAIQGEECVTGSGYVYCIGGWSQPEANQTWATTDSHYATISPSGIGQWKTTTPYPAPASGPKCVTYSRFIYCVQTHWNGSGGYYGPQDVFFAPISSEGIGNWTQTLGFSAVIAGCSEYNGYAYCYGGAVGCSNRPSPSPCPPPTNYAHYAPLLPNGTGRWLETTNVSPGWGPYVETGPFIYSLRGTIHWTTPLSNSTSEVDVARFSNDGISPWKKAAQIPLPWPGVCVSSGEFLYCIGGYNYSPAIYSVRNCYFTRITS